MGNWKKEKEEVKKEKIQRYLHTEKEEKYRGKLLLEKNTLMAMLGLANYSFYLN